jgi:hypothetical protein
MLTHNHIVIFSPPRSGTKLLAKIFEDFGYHIHGEWYALYSTYIDGNKSVRKGSRSSRIANRFENKFANIKEHIRRQQLYISTDKSVVTIWPESLSEFPFILNDFDNYHWVCLRRDPMSQMLSWWISSKNYNFDGLRTSKPVTIEEHDMQRMYWNYYTVYELQNWLVNNKSATLISFEDLISGNAKHFGTNYNISTIDEHTNLEALVHNMDEVKEWFNILEGKRSSDIDNFHN